jgi:hypothetical protein
MARRARKPVQATEGELQIGLRIVPYKAGLLSSQRKKLDRLRAHLFGGRYSRGFAFLADKGHPSDEFFHTSPEIREVLEKHPDWLGRPTGRIVYEIHPRLGLSTKKFNRKYPEDAFPKKTIYTQEYFPFMFPEGFAIPLDVWNEMTHKGIATDLERRTMELMDRRYPNYMFTPHGQNTDARWDQIKSFGLTKRWYRPGEYAAILKGVVEEGRERHRRPKTEDSRPEHKSRKKSE